MKPEYCSNVSIFYGVSFPSWSILYFAIVEWRRVTFGNIHCHVVFCCMHLHHICIWRRSRSYGCECTYAHRALPEEGCDVKEVMALHSYAFMEDIAIYFIIFVDFTRSSCLCRQTYDNWFYLYYVTRISLC